MNAADGETPLKTYSYDGLGRRVAENDWSAVTDLYYSAAGQVLEERERHWTEDPDIAAVVARYVWSPVYVNALILRDRDTDGNGSLEERLWAVQDANWNTVALVDSSGDVVERYAYTPYGQAFIMNGAYVEMTGGGVDWRYMFQGGRLDPLTGATQFGARDYDPALGRWRTLDPIGFAGGDVNLYRAFAYNPVRYVDPTGTIVPLVAGGIFVVLWLAEDSPAQAPTYPGEHVRRRGFDLEVAAVTTAPFVALGAAPSIYYTLTVSAPRVASFLVTRGTAIGGLGATAAERARPAVSALGQKAADLGTRAGQVSGVAKHVPQFDPFVGRGNPAGFGELIRWGTGAEAAAARTSSITLQEVQASGITRGVAEYWLNFYSSAVLKGQGGATAQERIKLMQRVLQLIGG